MIPYPKTRQLYRNRNKFRAEKASYNGVTYHSKAEAKYAQELDWMEKAGEVKSWTRQHKIELIVNGKRVGNYLIDFRVVFPDGRVELHEVKGFPTPEWQLKWAIAKAMELDEPLKLIRV